MGILHRVLSPAKINLFLKVLRKRDDGYHDIVSVMQPISLYDEILIEMENGSDIIVSCDNANVPCDRTNLAYRAAVEFFRTTGINRRLSITIKKNIPVAAGLGGGSSNAAAVLRALNEITSQNISTDNLIEIGAGIGSDVPFFIVGKSCIARGRGESLEPIELPKFWYILINPGFPVSTQWAYQNLNLTKSNEDINIALLKVSLEDHVVGIRQWQGLLANDLEEVTIGKHPEIKEIKDAMSAVGATGALMSGSGPTVFGIFPDKDKAEEAFGLLKGAFKQKRYIVFLAQGI
ncbi:MAG TPA: 4-(cytidine 5'-diphospho)-2-C-methyl-D-erythritol kinase [Thermodesulfobacteriota bacterium]|nr:4-(cytidine 5'-diphospho)-2-C-methyl-D-erythritol kinase [Thermodesulfobacteriota bacterium]